MAKTATNEKQWKKTKSMRFSDEDIELMNKGAEVKGMSVSDFLMYCVRKEFVGSSSISPDEMNELNSKVSQMSKLAEEIMITTNSLTNKTEYKLETELQEIIDKREEAEYQENFRTWFQASLSSIKISSNPVSLSKKLIKIGVYEYGMDDYAISILEHTADNKIPVRK